MFKNFLSEEVVQELIKRLIPLYPNEAERATKILLEEYELPINVAYMIMSMVHMAKSRDDILNWPLFDVRMSAFGLN